MLVLAGSGRAVTMPPVLGCGSCMVVGGASVAVGGISVAVAALVGVAVGVMVAVAVGVTVAAAVGTIMDSLNPSSSTVISMITTSSMNLIITHLIRLAAVSASSLDRVVAVVVRIGFFNHALHFLWSLVFTGVWMLPDGG